MSDNLISNPALPLKS